uniref:Ribosomal protein S13 n=1 Tax=Chloropicon maureeniae TaxID=1461542 RepID=A0A4D6C542_9CHLO|nr:ribosomal protein S13 [Chloropicon maureeniae]QBX98822.1 ribosomal protein S13 [Chloropicon maureeniae]
MVYLLNVYLPESQTVMQAIQQFQGIGPNVALQICSECGLSGDVKVSDLESGDVENLAKQIENFPFIETNLKRKIRERIERLIQIKSYRGRRHLAQLPSRGQRTHKNAQTRKRVRHF